MQTQIEGDVLVIRVPVSEADIERALPSKSGKTRMVASTRGFMAIPTPSGQLVKLSLNVTTDAE